MFYPPAECCPFNSDEAFRSPSDNSDKAVSNSTDDAADLSKMECEKNKNIQCEMLRKIRELGFAVTDLNLFLDTHPNCSEALELFTELSASLKSLKSDYQANYAPLYACESPDSTPFAWVDSEYKWPWEF